MGGRLFGGPTMVGRKLDWKDELGRWLKPFLDRLGHEGRRQMCPLYVSGLRSVLAIARAFSRWRSGLRSAHAINCITTLRPGSGTQRLWTELLVQADRLVGGSDAVLVIDDTAIPKKGTHSVGVAPQYASALGKTANCQTLVSLTLARGEVP